MKTILLLLVGASVFALDCETCLRTKAGSIFRSRRAVEQFKRRNPCPATGKVGNCKGYVVDHIVPLACADDIAVLLKKPGKANVQHIQRTVLDTPRNMQWQSAADSKAKDQWERQRCAELYADPAYWPDASGETR